MITIEEIISKSKPHGLDGEGRMTTFETSDHVISIVGGRRGLYGDFEDSFEVAIIEKISRDFVSGKFFPELSDSMGQIMPYITRSQLVEVVNKMVVD